MDFANKHIIITGASQGFGKDLAHVLAGEGTVLHLVARSDMGHLKKKLEDKGSHVRLWKKDLLDGRPAQEFLKEIAESMDLSSANFVALINNAGMLDPIGPAGKYDHEVFKQHLELNYVVPVMLTHAFISILQETECTKRVVMVSSGAADKPYFGWSHYCSTKAGVNMFVKVVGQEQVQQVNPVEIMAFNPGRIDTKMQDKIRNTPEQDFPMVHDFINAWKDNRLGDSSEIAKRLADRLLSDYYPSGKALSHRDI